MSNEEIVETKPKQKTSKRAFLLFALADLIIIAAIACWFLSSSLNKTVTGAVKVTAQVAAWFEKAFKPTVTYKTIIGGSIGKLNENPKLVVLTAPVVAHVVKSDEKTMFEGNIYLGTTTVEIRAPGKVQYYVPLDEVTEECFSFDSKKKELQLKIPRPALDREIIEVESDPDKVEVKKEIGWARLESYSGVFVEKQARKDLRKAVMAQGAHPLIREKAGAAAIDSIKQLLEPLSRELRDGVKLKIIFENESRKRANLTDSAATGKEIQCDSKP